MSHQFQPAHLYLHYSLFSPNVFKESNTAEAQLFTTTVSLLDVNPSNNKFKCFALSPWNHLLNLILYLNNLITYQINFPVFF